MLNFYLFSYLHFNFKMYLYLCFYFIPYYTILETGFLSYHSAESIFFFVVTNDFFFVLRKLCNTYLPWISSSFWHSWWPSFLKTYLPLFLVALCFQCLPPYDHFTVEFFGNISFIHIPKTELLILFLITASPWVTALTPMALVTIHINKLSIEAAHNNG